MSAVSLDLRLASRYLWGRKLRTLLTTLAVVFGVAIIFGLNGLLPGMLQSFRQSMVAAAGKVDLTVNSVSGGSFSPAIANKVSRVPGVAAVSPTLRKTLGLPQSKYSVSAVTVVGVDPAKVREVRQFPVSSGRFIQAGDNLDVAMSKDLAEKFGVTTGSTLELPTAQGLRTFKVVGLLNIPVLPGNEEVFAPLKVAQDLFNERGNINAVDVAFQPNADPRTVTDAVQRAVGEDYQAGGVESDSALFSSLKLGQIILNMFGIFALAMGGFIILNTFRTVVSERRRDIGMLRAVGARRSTILGMFFAESIIQGAFGTALGIAGGWLLAAGAIAGVTPLFKKFLNMPVPTPIFTPGTWVAAISLGIGVTVLGAVLPAFAAARITPLDALRPQVGEVYEKTMGRRGWTGVALCVLAVLGLVSGNTSLVGLSIVLLFVGVVLVMPAIVKPVSDAFGRLITLVFVREGDVARANLQRNPGRAAVTASAMMISMAIVVAMLGMVTSISDGFMKYVDKSLGADFVVIPSQMVLASGNVGAGPELVGKMKASPGVADVATLRLGTGDVNGGRVQFIGIDPVVYPKVASFEFSKGSSEADIGKLSRGRTALINGIYASQIKLGVGDYMKVDTPNGRKSYKVVGIGSDYLNAKLATAYISQDNLQKDFNVTANVLAMANMKPGADRAAVKKELAGLLKDYPQFNLYDAASFRADQLNTLKSSMSLLNVLVLVLALPSFLALLNTLAISVLARTREIGLLRAVGSLRRQIRRMVLAESLLMTALGTSFGILTGIWLSYVFVSAMESAGFPGIPYYFPTSGILAGLAIGIFFGVLASLIPARQAARLDVIEALKWE